MYGYYGLKDYEMITISESDYATYVAMLIIIILNITHNIANCLMFC